MCTEHYHIENFKLIWKRNSNIPRMFSLLKVILARCWPHSTGTKLTRNMPGPWAVTLFDTFWPEGPQILISNVPSPAFLTSTNHNTHHLLLLTRRSNHCEKLRYFRKGWCWRRWADMALTVASCYAGPWSRASAFSSSIAPPYASLPSCPQYCSIPLWWTGVCM